jgi:hypothetical protein
MLMILNAVVKLSKENLIDAVYCSLACFCTVHLSKRKSNFPHIQYKEIQNEAVAKSYMTDGLLIYGEIVAHFLIY